MRALTAGEVQELLGRNFALNVRVKAHRVLVAAGGWSQVDDAGRGVALFEYPIPPAGFGFKDDKFGNVVIFPDAAGELRFTCDVPSGVLDQVNKPRYESPAGNSITNILADLQAAGGKILVAAVLVAVVVGVGWAVTR